MPWLICGDEGRAEESEAGEREGERDGATYAEAAKSEAEAREGLDKLNDKDFQHRHVSIIIVRKYTQTPKPSGPCVMNHDSESQCCKTHAFE